MKTLGPVLLYSQERLELSCTIPCSLPLIYLSKWDLRCTETCNKGSDRSLNGACLHATAPTKSSNGMALTRSQIPHPTGDC